MEIFKLLAEVSGARVEPELVPLREGELERSCMDPARAQRMLGWQAKVTLRGRRPGHV